MKNQNKPFKWKQRGKSFRYRFVRAPFNRYDGFTLIETVLSLFVLSAVLFLFLPILEINHQYFTTSNETSSQDWYVFTIQLEQTIKNFKLVSVADQRLIFQTEEQDEIKKPVIEYYAGKHLIRKSSLNGGYEPMLMGVASLRFRYEDYFVRMSVEFLNGEKYEYCIFKE